MITITLAMQPTTNRHSNSNGNDNHHNYNNARTNANNHLQIDAKDSKHASTSRRSRESGKWKALEVQDNEPR